MKTWGSGCVAPPFLTSALDGGEWSVSHSDRSTPGEIVPGTHRIRGWLGPGAGLKAVEERKTLPCREPSPVRPFRGLSL
jgi:hypothetical protein